MKNLIKLLGILFILQLALVIWHWLPDEPAGFAESNAKLTDFDPADIDEIRISSSKTDKEEAQSVQLSKQESGWVLPAYFNARANSDKAEKFLTDLLSLKTGWPVATTDQSAKRFEVSEDSYQRKIELLGKGKVIETVYLGTTPGLRKVHARVPSSANTYAVDFAVFSAPVAGKEWVDKSLLQVDQANITSMQHGDWSVRKREDRWEITDLEDGFTTRTDTVESYAIEVASLGFDELLGSEEKPEFKFADTSTQLTVGLKDGSTLLYRFAKPEENHAILKRSDNEQYFKLANYQLGTLLNTDRSKFIQAATAAPTTDAETEVMTEAETSTYTEAEAGDSPPIVE